MYGDAAVAADYFDAVVDDPRYDFPLFAPPNRSVETTDYMIAFHVSTLIRDGGTLQIGIGAIGDAVTYLLKLRHVDHESYLRLVHDSSTLDRFGNVIDRLGGTAPFREGLYAATEMLVDGFLELYRCGILKRKVYPHAGVQRLINAGRIAEAVTPATLEALIDEGIISEQLTAGDFELLQALGVFRPDVVYEAGAIGVGGDRLSADLADRTARNAIVERCLGERLEGGKLAHACFFLGPRSFYDALRRMDRA